MRPLHGITKKQVKMFDSFDDENFEMESNNEGFFVAYDGATGMYADGVTSEDALSNLAEENSDMFFGDHEFCDF